MKKLLAAIRSARAANKPTPEREAEIARLPHDVARGIPGSGFVRIL